ncbi:MAG TPA: ABC transporter permease [Thermoanaerobaculia bacterium]|nr:ABC transporter permease [Thermoanaerobaculia bacterium]
MLSHDLKQSFRALRSQRGVTVVAVLSLGVGIALNVTIFSLINEVLLRPPAVSAPDELVSVYMRHEGGDRFGTSSYPDYVDLREQNEAFSDVVAHSLMLASFEREGRSQALVGALVSGNFFEALGVQAARGRLLEPGEEEPLGAHPVAVVDHRFWLSDLGGRPDVVGSTVRLNATRFTVVGVLPEEFTGLFPGLAPAVYLPLAAAADVEPAGQISFAAGGTGSTWLDMRGRRWLWVLGRLRPGVTVDQADAQVGAVAARLAAAFPPTNGETSMVAVPTRGVRVHPELDGVLSAAATLLQVCVGLVLLIVCANVANMLLARAAARRREVGVRLALGAGRARLVRLLLTESLLLAALGGALGLGLALLANRLIESFQPASLPIAISLDLVVDHRVLLFTLLVTGLTGIVFGLAPALQAARADVVDQIRREEPAPRLRGRLGRFGFGHVLVAAQVALCLALLVGAGLLGRSLLAAGQVPLGFDPQRIGVMVLETGRLGYEGDEIASRQREMLEAVAAMPGVEATSWASRSPLDVNFNNSELFIEGVNEEDERGLTVSSVSASAGYFETLEVTVIEGRSFDLRDTPATPRVAVVSRSFVDRYWPGESALGKRLRTATKTPIEVVGVVEDYKVRSVGEAPQPYVHFARDQVTDGFGILHFRTAGPAVAALEAVRRRLVEMEPDLMFLDSATLASRVDLNLLPVRFGATLLGGLSLIAVLLAAVGLYGLIAYWVSRRTREIGLRVALGARPAEIVGMVVRQGMVLAVLGLLGGSLLAFGVARLLRGILLGVEPGDPVTFLMAAVVLLAVTLLANGLPARRASRVDPMVALRDE